MIAKVVDTNVLAVANGRHESASAGCRLASIAVLKQILDQGKIVVDGANEILGEYKSYCSPTGQPGVGDMFYREILLNYSGKVIRVDLPKNEDGSFTDFPDDPALAGFDPSDRKFVAAALRSHSPVVNATDPDWLQHKAALERNGLTIEFACTEDQSTWFRSSHN